MPGDADGVGVKFFSGCDDRLRWFAASFAEFHRDSRLFKTFLCSFEGFYLCH